MAQIQGGPAIPVSVVTGGKIKGGKAIPVYGYTSPPTDGRRAAAGPARPVYVVSDAQMAAGTFQMEGGPAMPMYVAPSGLSVVGAAAQPVYVVGGSLGGAFTPASIAGLVAWYQPKGAASLATSYVNLANPGAYDCAPGVAPTFSASTGWTFNGTTQYLKTGITINSGWSAFVQFTNLADGNNPFGYSAEVGKSFFIDSVNSSPRYGNGGIMATGAAMTEGCLGFSGQQAYRNGAAVGTAIGAWSGGATSYPDLYIGARVLNTSGVANSFCGLKIQAFVIYNTTLTAAQVQALSTYMAVL